VPGGSKLNLHRGPLTRSRGPECSRDPQPRQREIHFP
jgi:hypothetical protein